MSSLCPLSNITDSKIALCCAAPDATRIPLKSSRVSLQNRWGSCSELSTRQEEARLWHISWENIDSHREMVSLILQDGRPAASNQTRALSVRGGSAQPSSRTLVSGSFPTHFSSATDTACWCLLGRLDLTERPWRRTLSFQSDCPSGRLWAVCTCRLRRGRCWGTSLWNQLQEEINKPLDHPETRADVRLLRFHERNWCIFAWFKHSATESWETLWVEPLTP